MTAKLKTTTPITKVVGALATILALLTGAVLLNSGPASGAASYAGDTTSGTITINSGANQTQLTDPDVHIDMVIDDVSGAIDATTTFVPTFTPTFVGPFDLVFYAGASITQQGAATGTIDVNRDVALTLDARLAIAVYNMTGATPSPGTDQKFTGPGCFVDVTFDFTGHLDEGTGVLTLADSQFTIPSFPAGDSNCWLATDELNNRLAGANNAVDLTFGGTVTTTTTSTTSTTEATTSSTSTTTSTTSTTSSTTSTTIDPCLPTVEEDPCNPSVPGGLTTPGTPASSTTTTTAVPPTTTPGGGGLNDYYWES